MWRWTLPLTIIMLMIAGAGLTGAAAQDDSQDPVAMLKIRDARIQKLIASADTSSAAVKEELKKIINQAIDFHELSKRALGKYWNDRTAEEQQEFIDVFRQLIRNSSVRKLDIYKADKIEYDPPRTRGGMISVRSVAHKKDSSMEVVYRMHEVDGALKIYDLVVDDVSTARNYRDGFYRKLAKTPFPEMLDELRDRLDTGSDDGADTL